MILFEDLQQQALNALLELKKILLIVYYQFMTTMIILKVMVKLKKLLKL